MSSSSDQVFDALGDPTRRRVFADLSAMGYASCTDLSRRLPITRQAVNKHLNALLDAGLVATERRGRAVVYRVQAEPLTEAVRWMTQVGEQW
ncbi:MAG: metalloregulator ArsR/SmtB family transcription factor, partial [Actinomycetota bacterium]